MVCLALMLVLIHWCNDSFAYEVSKTQGGTEIKWKNSDVTYLVNPSGDRVWPSIADVPLIFYVRLYR